jgi:ubiquinone/menaquinone biosynthesis C-methylase UbiE
LGWRNFDASPRLRLQRLAVVGGFLARGKVVFPAEVEYGDVVKGLPLADRSCQGVYCSHVLEHLSLSDLRKAMRETHRVLAAGGLFRLVVPDLEYHARVYLENPSAGAAIDFMRATRLGNENRKRSIMPFLRDWLGNSNHLWMWDFKSLSGELSQASFSEIRRAEFGDSPDPKFNEVETADRWHCCLGIECRRS